MPPIAPPELTLHRQAHTAMRSKIDRLHAAIVGLDTENRRRATAIGRWFGRYAHMLRAHHDVEDAVLFPALAVRVPTYEFHEATVGADHRRLDEIVHELGAALGRLAGDVAWPAAHSETVLRAGELRCLLGDHLDLEDGDVLPLFERHFSAEEYDGLQRLATQRRALYQLGFSTPRLIRP